jgi:hypothetical protein
MANGIQMEQIFSLIVAVNTQINDMQVNSYTQINVTMTRDPLLRNLNVGVIMHIITKQIQKKTQIVRINTLNGSYLWVSLW